MRTVAWAIKAGLSYRHFQSVHGVGREEEAYLAALSLQHIRWAEKLLHVSGKKRRAVAQVQEGRANNGWGETEGGETSVVGLTSCCM